MSTTPFAVADGIDFIVQDVPQPIQKNYNIFRIVFNQSEPVTRDKANGGFDGIHEEIELDDAYGTVVHVIGLLVAFLVSIIIIVGIAFVIRKIRKNQGPVDDDEEEEPNKEMKTTTRHSEYIEKSEVAADNEIPQVFSITFPDEPKKHRRIIPKFLRPKPKKVDIERIKRELSHVYVY